MKFPVRDNVQFEEVQNGALILVLLRENSTWDELCGRFAHADPADLGNTNTMVLLQKLRQMRDLKLITYEDEEGVDGGKPVGKIVDTNLWSEIRVGLGGMSASDAAMISRHSNGIAVAPIFGRPRQNKDQVDIFVLMPFDAKLKNVYANHISRLGEELGLVIRRADDFVEAGPFMAKVWDNIYAAELIIADCTQLNPNVFYEMGIAHTVGKKVILITRSEDDLPSDIKHYDYIPYVYDPEGVEELIEGLRRFIKSHFDL